MVVKVRVRVTVDILIPDVWTKETTVWQIEQQARDSALQRVRGGLAVDGVVVTSNEKTPAVLVGDPEVIMVTVAPKDSK